MGTTTSNSHAFFEKATARQVDIVMESLHCDDGYEDDNGDNGNDDGDSDDEYTVAQFC